MSDDANEVFADVLEEFVPESTEKLAEFADGYLRGVRIRSGFLGLAIGLAVGAAGTYFFVNQRLQTKYAHLADEEIAEMREHYQAKGRALEAQAGKTDLAALVKERGYVSPEPETSTSPPMAVRPPQSVLDSEDEAAGEEPDDSEMGEDAVEGPEGVKVRGETAVRNIFKDREQPVPHKWDEHAERRRRSPDRPYVVHYDERHEMEGYSDVAFTYYAADDVLCNERDEVVDPAERDDLVGEANLERFGHGNPDPMIVFVRNDNLEILYEIIKSPNSFAEEVHGFSHESSDRGNLERMRRRERDEGT